MRGGLLFTILGVIIALVAAWFLVDGLLHAMFFLVKLAIVLVVGAIVFFAARAVFARPRA